VIGCEFESVQTVHGFDNEEVILFQERAEIPSNGFIVVHQQ
jgi:hypothetical protein